MNATSFLLSEFLKNSNYKITQFSAAQIASFEESIFLKEVRGKQFPKITGLSREMDIKLTPEEAVRQLYLRVLHFDYGYPLDRIQLDFIVGHNDAFQTGTRDVGVAGMQQQKRGRNP